MNKTLCLLLSILLCYSLLLPVLAEEPETLSICTAEDFLAFAENCRLDAYSEGLTVRLEADIDLTGTDFSCVPTFSGTFDGGGHTIRGLSITGNGSYQGLFRYLTDTAIVQDLRVEGTVAPQGSRAAVGGIVGSNAGQIINCTFTGTVTAGDKVGGIAGINTLTGILDSCSVNGSVSGIHFAGGIAGENAGVIRNCTNHSAINTTAQQNSVDISDITIDSLTGSEFAAAVTDIGGIAGISTGVIRSCTNHGDVGYKHMGYNIGGIAGCQAGYITDCVNLGSISGRKEVGGIVGQMEPITILEYSADTLQILQGQLDTLSELIDRASANAEGNASSISGLIAILKDHAKNAEDAAEQLSPDFSEAPDIDGTLAALNTLGSSLRGMASTLDSLSKATENTTETLVKDLQAISDQMDVIQGTIGNGSENLGGSITDISDADTADDLIGKVENCVNQGSVLADANAGGIAGAISIENDLDPDADVQINGNTSLNFAGLLRAVVLNCENSGPVTAAKQYAGGITGLQAMGLVKGCLNTGDLSANRGSHLGGVAGFSAGYIRQCYVTCRLAGDTHVGGIAGSGAVVTDCMSMTELMAGTEQLGAVLGSLTESYADEAEPIRNNVYLCVGSDPGGIDGISYAGLAQPMEAEAFLVLEELPEAFRSSTVTFVLPDGTVQTVTVATGQTLADSDIPALPTKAGYSAVWRDLTDVTSNGVYFDTVVESVYTPLLTVLQSEAVAENGLPILLLQGVFQTSDPITMSSAAGSPVLSADQTLYEFWNVSIPESKSPITGRYLLPEGLDSKELRLMVHDAEGTWTEADFTMDGSYAVFSVERGMTQLAVIRETQPIWIWFVIAGAAILAIAAAIVTIVLYKKKK